MFRLLRLTTMALTLLSVFATSTLAADESRTLVRLDISTEAGNEFVHQNQGMLDVIVAKPGHYADVAADARALNFLAETGHAYEVLQRDLEASLAYDNKGVGFGIYHTFSESTAFVDSLHMLYPQVVSAKWSLGQTLQNNDIWCFRVSANPEVDENEPEIFIDGMHHAREIMASEFPIMFAEYLASNYGTDPEITWLLDNRELYIVPIVNPDGFLYNEATNPDGGGMWRKNRRQNSLTSYGVDLNRNYPYQWGFDDVGSSSNPTSDIYRGPGAGSELEVQAIMDFINSREIRTHDSVHTYSNLLLYPWSYISTPTPDGAIFDHMAAKMTKFNGYTAGQPGNVLYDVNGGSVDWHYGDESKHTRFFSFTSEIGGNSDGFWPDESRRGQLFQENIWPHIYLMRAAGTWVTAHSPVVLSPAKSVLPGQSAELSFTLENESVYDSILDLDLTVKTDDPWLQFAEAERTIGSLASLATTDLTGNGLPFSVDANCPNGHQATVTVVVHLADGDLSYPLSFTIGTIAPVVTEDFESGPANWTLTGNWATTTGYSHSAVHSLTDSPGGNYSNMTMTSATLNTAVNAVRLQFWHRFEIEDGWDYGRVQIGVDGVWNTVASYTGSQTNWEFADIYLGDYIGQQVQVRFVMETDQAVIDDGWYIDDVTILGSPINARPDSPVAVSPLSGSPIAGGGLLVVNNSSDPDGGTVDYGFRVYSDANCTQLASSVDNVVEGPGQTSWSLPALANGTYYWRAYAGNAVERSDLSPAEPFAVATSSGVSQQVLGQLGLRVLDGVTESSARLQLNLPSQQDVQVEIYDTRGARVRRLHTGSMASGSRVLVWDGRDGSGRAAASGVYFVRLTTGREALTGRVVIVR